jgi:hypothetical protein
MINVIMFVEALFSFHSMFFERFGKCTAHEVRFHCLNSLDIRGLFPETTDSMVVCGRNAFEFRVFSRQGLIQFRTSFSH